MHTIVSWPMGNSSYFRFDYGNKTKYILSQSLQGRWVNWKHTAPYIVQWITERICLISLTLSTKYIWQAFYQFIVFRKVCTIMIMRCCYVQTNEYDLQDRTYPTLSSHHKLHNNNENKLPVFLECKCNKWQNMVQQTSQAHNHGKYDNNG